MIIPIDNKAPERPAKRRKYHYFEDITVLVGENRSKFVVHKNIVCERSEFFHAACNGKWRESIERTVLLPEIDKSTFGKYIGWLYTASIDVGGEETATSCPKYNQNMNVTERTAVQSQLIDAYGLGDMLQDAKFCNAVVDEMIKCTEAVYELPCLTELIEIWARLPQASKMEKLFVDYFGADCNAERFVQGVAQYPPSLIQEIAKASVVERHVLHYDRKPRNRPKCFYHDHKDVRDRCA